MYEKIHLTPIIALAQKYPLTASKQLRKRYYLLPDHAHSFAIGGIYKDERLKDWFELAVLLLKSDPSLAKSILIRILMTKNYVYTVKDERFFINIRKVAETFYEIEKNTPETRSEGKYAVLSALIDGISPDQGFWQECLETAYDFSFGLVKTEGSKHILLMAKVAFYAEKESAFQKKVFEEVEYCLKNVPSDVSDKTVLFRSLMHFCFYELTPLRNNDFSADPDSDLYKMTKQFFWKWVDEYAREQSWHALKLLQTAIHSDDAELSSQATEQYKQIFHKIALHDPQKVSECIRDIASSSKITFAGLGDYTEVHQHYNLYDVFDTAIPILMAIDHKYGILPFSSFIVSHGRVPHRMQVKYKKEIDRARVIEIQKRKT